MDFAQLPGGSRKTFANGYNQPFVLVRNNQKWCFQATIEKTLGQLIMLFYVSIQHSLSGEIIPMTLAC